MNPSLNVQEVSKEGFRSPPSFEELQKLYRLRAHSIPFGLGLCLLILGFALVGISVAVSVTDLSDLIPEVDTVLHVKEWAVLGIVAFALGVFVVAADYCKRRYVRPYICEIRTDFVRAVLQEGLLPSNFDKSQFRFKVKRKKGKLYEIRFSLDCPNKTSSDLAASMKKIAASFGCANTYSFTEDIYTGSKYGRGYRYCLLLEMSDLASAYESAGV